MESSKGFHQLLQLSQVKLIACSIFLTGALSLGFAQFTLNQNHFPGPGYTLIQKTTEVTSFDPGGAGANQSWDFSGYAGTESDTTNFISPEAGNPFPNATVQLTSTLQGKAFMQVAPSYVAFLGISGAAEDDFGLFPEDAIASFSPPYKLMKYPCGYGCKGQSQATLISAIKWEGDLMSGLGGLPKHSAISSNSALLKKSMQLAGMEAGDSARSTITFKTGYEMDAWGTLKLPGKQYDAMRLKTMDTTNFKLEVKLASMGGLWVDFSTILPGGTDLFSAPDIDTNYSWFAKGMGWPIVTQVPGDDANSSTLSWVTSDISTNIIPLEPSNSGMNFSNKLIPGYENNKAFFISFQERSINGAIR